MKTRYMFIRSGTTATRAVWWTGWAFAASARRSATRTATFPTPSSAPSSATAAPKSRKFAR